MGRWMFPTLRSRRGTLGVSRRISRKGCNGRKEGFLEIHTRPTKRTERWVRRPRKATVLQFQRAFLFGKPRLWTRSNRRARFRTAGPRWSVQSARRLALPGAIAVCWKDPFSCRVLLGWISTSSPPRGNNISSPKPRNGSAEPEPKPSAFGRKRGGASRTLPPPFLPTVEARRNQPGSISVEWRRVRRRLRFSWCGWTHSGKRIPLGYFPPRNCTPSKREGTSVLVAAAPPTRRPTVLYASAASAAPTDTPRRLALFFGTPKQAVIEDSTSVQGTTTRLLKTLEARFTETLLWAIPREDRSTETLRDPEEVSKNGRIPFTTNDKGTSARRASNRLDPPNTRLRRREGIRGVTTLPILRRKIAVIRLLFPPIGERARPPTGVAFPPRATNGVVTNEKKKKGYSNKKSRCARFLSIPSTVSLDLPGRRLNAGATGRKKEEWRKGFFEKRKSQLKKSRIRQVKTGENSSIALSPPLVVQPLQIFCL